MRTKILNIYFEKYKTETRESSLKNKYKVVLSKKEQDLDIIRKIFSSFCDNK